MKDMKQPYPHPVSVLYDPGSTTQMLWNIVNDTNLESRVKILAYNQLRAKGQKIDKQELLGVIVENAFDQGLDVLASFADGTSRYIYHNSYMIFWEVREDDEANRLTRNLFDNSQTIVDRISPWDRSRKQQPAKGMARITFLSSKGYYFVEGEGADLFRNPIVSPALISALELFKFLSGKDSQRRADGQ
jgi:hypothetical protein